MTLADLFYCRQPRMSGSATPPALTLPQEVWRMIAAQMSLKAKAAGVCRLLWDLELARVAFDTNELVSVQGTLLDVFTA